MRATALTVAAPLAAQDRARSTRRGSSRHIQTLSSDAFEGRGPATPGETKTVDYISREFAAAGLAPGGDCQGRQAAWTQAVPLLKSDIVGAPSFTLKTAGRRQPLTQGEQIALRSPMNGQDHVALAGVPLVFAGYGVTAPERGWDDFKDVDVRGKIIVVLINDPDFEGGEGDFGGKAMTYYGRWTYKFEEAARRGAAGVMIVHETAPASYGWDNGQEFEHQRHVRHRPRRPRRAAHAGFESWIQRDFAAVALFKAAGLDFDAAKASARRKDFRPVDLKASLDAHARPPRPRSSPRYNVVGRLPGTKRPDETIIYTAHRDHLGIGLPDANGDRIYNGALDNATGIAQLHRAGPRLRQGAADRTLGRVPRRRRRGKGPARARLLCRQPALSAGQDGRGDQHRRARRVRAGARLQHLGQRQARPARPAVAEGASAAAAIRPTRVPKRAASTARTISPSPRSACRRSAFDSGEDLSSAAPRAARRWPRTISPSAITSPTTNIRPTGT